MHQLIILCVGHWWRFVRFRALHIYFLLGYIVVAMVLRRTAVINVAINIVDNICEVTGLLMRHYNPLWELHVIGLQD